MHDYTAGYQDTAYEVVCCNQYWREAYDALSGDLEEADGHIEELENKCAELESELEKEEGEKHHWWCLACGYSRILHKVKSRVMPPDKYMPWVEKFIDKEVGDLTEKFYGKKYQEDINA